MNLVSVEKDWVSEGFPVSLQTSTELVRADRSPGCGYSGRKPGSAECYQLTDEAH